MKIRIPFFALLGLIVLVCPELKGDSAVAILCMLSGKATVTTKGAPADLKLFDRLSAGDVIHTEKGAKATIAFLSGERFEIGEGVQATVQQNKLETKGAVKSLSSVAAMAKLAPIAASQDAAHRPAAVRIRSGDSDLIGLYPNQDAAVIANQARLEIMPEAEFDKYKVEIENESGDTIFSVETPATTVDVPAGVLKPASTYYWRVRTSEMNEPAERIEATFVTVSAEDAEARTALQLQAESSGDLSLLVLLAQVDYRLGMQREACKRAKMLAEKDASLQQLATAFSCTEPD